MLILGGIVLALCAYFLGSIPFGLVLTRLFTSIDIRKTGSGNIGATNVRRIAGNRLGILTLIGDVLKGAFPVYLSIALFMGEAHGLAQAVTAFVAAGAFAGHLFPVYLGFKTGGQFDRQPGWHQRPGTGCDHHITIDGGKQIKPGALRRCVTGQVQVFAVFKALDPD